MRTPPDVSALPHPTPVFDPAADGADPGIHAMLYTDRVFAGAPCLFLDRDGVVVEETHYLHRVEDVRLIDGVAAAIARVKAAGLPVVIVTNQAGIGRGIYDWAAFEAVQGLILSRLAEDGATIDMVLACAYHEKGQGPYRQPDHPWRKPNLGMLAAAHDALKMDLPRSLIVGDKLSDIEAGLASGLRFGALTLTGHGRDEAARHAGSLAELRQGAGMAVSVVETPVEAIDAWLDCLGAAAGDAPAR